MKSRLSALSAKVELKCCINFAAILIFRLVQVEHTILNNETIVVIIW